jgi:hypothetical protein
MKDGVRKEPPRRQPQPEMSAERATDTRYSIFRSWSKRRPARPNSHLPQPSQSDICLPRRLPVLDTAIPTQFEAYGVITAPGLGECRWQSLRTDCWKRQPILPRLHLINDWTSAHWPFRPQYVLRIVSIWPSLTCAIDRSIINIPVIGLPASLAIA